MCAALFSGIAASSQTPQQLHEWLPAAAGWAIAQEIEVFDPNNLFDRINGAAPLFIENNFREMTSMEYSRGEDYITIQAYRHATPEDAFGMYASERSSGMEFLPIGGEAQADAKNVYFFAGAIYVKMWSGGTGDSKEALRQIAAGLAAGIDSAAGYPSVMKRFPQDGKVPYHEAYIVSSYIGHEFLNGVYTADYVLDDVPFQAFVIDAQTPEAAREMLVKYFTFTKQPLDFEPGRILIRDRYNGNIPILWPGGRYIAGIFAESGKPVPGAEVLLKMLAGELGE